MKNHEQFIKYYEKIILTKSKKDTLLEKRKVLKGKIESLFDKKPTFIPQGSFAMKTVINSLYQPYDIDYGVCFNHIDTSQGKHTWKRPATVHKWIHEVLENHTENGAEKRSKCVRVIYSGGDINYHVDLPCYVKSGEKYYVADKAQNKWIESHPKDINKWFITKNKNTDDQLRRVVVYLKGWKDYLEKGKLIGGFQLTVLVTNNFVPAKGDDEQAFVKTVSQINKYIQNNNKLNHPVVGSKLNIFENYTPERLKKIGEEFQKLYENTAKASKASTNIESAKLWQEVFGDRFPIPKEEIKNRNNAVRPVAAAYNEKYNTDERGCAMTAITGFVALIATIIRGIIIGVIIAIIVFILYQIGKAIINSIRKKQKTT